MSAVTQFSFDLLTTIMPLPSPIIPSTKCKKRLSNVYNYPVFYLSPSELRGIRDDIIWAERKRLMNGLFRFDRDWIGNGDGKLEYTRSDHRLPPGSPV